MSADEFDLVILGGGPVGLALAAALRDSEYRVLLLETRSHATAADDRRVLALSWGSRLLLERLGAWNDLSAATAIHQVHVSCRGRFGRALLDRTDIPLPALGYVASYAGVHRAVLQQAASSPRTRIVEGARTTLIEPGDEHVCIRYESGDATSEVRAALLAIADGSGDTISGDTPATVRDYHQCAVVGMVRASRAHDHIAYERFTEQGPLALLPYQDRYALVWTCDPQRAEELVSLVAEPFLMQLQNEFGERTGRFTQIDHRSRFPLRLKLSAQITAARRVWLGNAAQNLHPVAGQGFNLGLRDAWTLSQLLLGSTGDPGSSDVLRSYRARRRMDRGASIVITDTLARLFSNDHAALSFASGCGLTFLASLPAAKRGFMQQMMFGITR